ncbi:unnamed protein product [Ceutorhynchus assimilis]|uniref:Uncharacterized protein n=1 Tax=Ceutorhynchus assimilis TaxID=467358 RepID=A0A9N9QG72_9CUCU|nr:unnamed protein product [Ceutorhynchus assimilis]
MYTANYSFVIVICFIKVIFCDSCDNISVPVYVNRISEKIEGCINKDSFPNKIVNSIDIDCESASIQILPANFVADLNRLNELLIQGCSLKTIQPGAFFNLPKITDMDFSVNELRNIQAGVFSLIPAIKYMNLSRNFIVFVEDDAFSHLPNLEDLDLSFNRLKTLSKSWFTNTLRIEEFYVNNNEISAIPENMFAGWQQIRLINFNYNQLVNISDKVFSGTIESITFHHNLLTSINIEAFSEDISIDQFDISNNYISNLSPMLFDRITVKNFQMYGNPMECTCLYKIEQTLQKKGVNVEVPKLSNSDRNCQNVDVSVPMCGVSLKNEFCNATADDNGVISGVTKYLRELGFRDLRDWYEKCI